MAEKLSERQIQDIKEAFSLFDRDGDGFVTTEECGTIMRSLGQNPTQQEIRDMVREVCLDQGQEGHDAIDVSDFLFMMARRLTGEDNTESEIRDAFKVLDKRGQGVISVSELGHVLTTLGEKLTVDEVQEIISELHVDENGNVDYEEFVSMMASK